MSDELDHDQPTKKSLSEISHLFLTSVRDNATGGTRPTRLPPGSFAPGSSAGTPAVPPARPDVSIDVTPEEFARTFGTGRMLSGSPLADEAHVGRPPVGPVSALICPQLSGRQADRAREYARHIAAGGERVGLIEVDAAECRVTCFELSVGDPAEAAEPTTVSDVRPFADGLEELAWDVDRWLLLLPNPRLPEARALLREVRSWTLLSTCDHDGVVSCYRAVKGLADVPRARLTLALLDAADAVEAGRVHRKIAGVCEQFLDWPVTAEPSVEATDAVDEHVALIYAPRSDRGAAPQWQAVGEFLARAGAELADPAPQTAAEDDSIEPVDDLPTEPMPAPAVAPTTVAEFVISPTEPPAPPQAAMKPAEFAFAPSSMDDVADLPGGVVTEAAVLSVVMGAAAATLVECPVSPPACPAAKLAVGRDRRLVLLAVATPGLGEVRSIAAAYKWVAENRPLLTMALPQFAIDAGAAPRLRLVVDRADAGADLLLPMNENANVTVQTYRTLRWGGRVGLLLEAA